MATPPTDAPKTSAVPPKLAAVPAAPAPAAPNTYHDTATWKHLPQPVGAEQFNQDKAACTKKGNNAPGAGSQEMKFFIVYTQCMRSSGYAPN